MKVISFEQESFHFDLLRSPRQRLYNPYYCDLNSRPMFPESFYQHLANHTLTGIKAGPQRERFTPFWVVRVGQRVFARSWNKSESGWFGSL